MALVVESPCEQTDRLTLCHRQGPTCLIARSDSPMNAGQLASINHHLVLTTFLEVPAMTVDSI